MLQSNRSFNKGCPIFSRRPSNGRSVSFIANSSRLRREATTEKKTPLETATNLAATVLVASLAFYAPDVAQEWNSASAAEYQSAEDQREALINRRKQLLEAAREKAMKAGGGAEKEGTSEATEAAPPVKSRLDMLTESVKKQQKNYDEQIKKSQTAVPWEKKRSFSFPGIPKFSPPDLPKLGVPGPSKSTQPESVKPTLPAIPEGSIPGSSKPTIPELPKLSKPELPKFSAPEIPKFKAPGLPKFSAPEIPKFKTPELPKFSTPEVPKFSAPEAPKFKAPEAPKPEVPQFKAPEVPKPDIPQFKAPEAPKPPRSELPKLETPALPKLSKPKLPSFNAPDLPKFKAPELPKFKSPDLPKFKAPELPKPKLPSFKAPGATKTEPPVKPFPIPPLPMPAEPEIPNLKREFGADDTISVPKGQLEKPSPGESALDDSKKRFPGLESKPGPDTPFPAPVRPAPVPPLPLPSRPAPIQPKRQAIRQQIEKKQVQRRKGALPLWATQLLMLVVFGGFIYSITVLYDTTTKALERAISAADRFLLGLQFKYDRTEKK